MWGACLDHMVEVEVVTADGKIQRASETQNSDLFYVSTLVPFPRPTTNQTRAYKARGHA